MCVCLCVQLALLPALAVKRRTLAVISLRLSCVWKGRTVPGHSDRTCQLPLASDVLVLQTHTVGSSVLR